MNFNKFLNSSYLKENPLCGISTYKDELNLATGVCERQVKKYELTGNELFYPAGQAGTTTILVYFSPSGIKNVGNIVSYDCFCSHYKIGSYYSPSENEGVQYTSVNLYFRIKQSSITNFKTYLQQQYAAGTPVCVWYVLATPETETITVPSGLSGTEEGYLIQDGTPTPTNPIYPTANTVEKWFDMNHYIMGTDTDTITTLPAVLYPNDTTVTVGLKGNMVQTGTPTPDNPIQPDETGERTENLFDINKLYSSITVEGESFTKPSSTGNNYDIFSGTAGSSQPINVNKSMFLKAGSYVFSRSADTSVSQSLYAYNDIEGKTTLRSTTTSNKFNFTLNYDSYVTIRIGNSNAVTISNLEISAGSTELTHYEPFGYKIPINVNSQIANIYLKTTQVTRQIKKLVLTGEETWFIFSENYPSHFITHAISDRRRGITPYCTHYVGSTATNYSGLKNAQISVSTSPSSDNRPRTTICDTRFLTIDDFKVYLAAQYAAGIPVTIWYVLAESETGIVNEPIRNIGDYADEVSGISIPVTVGENTLSIGTTLQPSDVTVNYKGWHPVMNGHESESGQWD